MRKYVVLLLVLIAFGCTDGTITVNTVTYRFSEESFVVVDGQKQDLTIKSGTPLLENDYFVAAFAAVPQAYHKGYDIGLSIRNKSDSSVTVHWQKAVLIDYDGRGHAIGLSGMKYADMSRGVQNASIIPRLTHTSFVVIMADTVRQEYNPASGINEWEHDSVLPPYWFLIDVDCDKDRRLLEAKDACERRALRSEFSRKVVSKGILRLVVPIEVKGVTSEYDFILKIDSYELGKKAISIYSPTHT